MRFLVAIIHHRLSEAQKVSRLSRVSQTGSELGLWKDKVCIMEVKLCRIQVRTLVTQLLSILEAHSSLFHQMCSTKSKVNGLKLCLK
jgi:hypothetical protein